MLVEIPRLVTDIIHYFFIVATFVESSARLQNVLSRLANSSRTWNCFVWSLKSELIALKWETLNCCSHTIPLTTVLGYGTSLQIILVLCTGMSYPPLENLAILVLLASCSWFFRSPRQGIGYALAWSYYFGYLRIMLPELMRHERRYKGGDIAGFFILLPADCQVYDKIEENDPRMLHVGNTEPIKRDVGGQIGRPYIHSVYEVRGSRVDNSFLAYVEYPTPIKHLATMSKEPYSSYMHFSEADRQYQLHAFGSTLEAILRDRVPADLVEASDKSVKDFFQIVYFDGARNNIAARIGEHAWNMAGHARGTENHRLRRAQYRPQESTDETF